MTRSTCIRSIAAVGLFAVFFAACATRSISDPGLRSGNRTYVGELSEFDVLGDAEPGEVAFAAPAPALQSGDSVLLVQSGAGLPDPELRAAFGDALQITTFSGVPLRRPGSDPRPGRSLRRAARLGGCKAVIAVWGVLESAQRGTSGQIVSWVPILGWGVRDQELETRIRLRFMVVDVQTGAWRAFEPEPITDVVATSLLDRGLQDVPDRAAMDQAALLKRAAFASGVRELLGRLGLR